MSKSPLRSKTIHFNLWSGVFVHAIWPFLPPHFRQQPYAMAAVTSWFTLGNIGLRLITTEALNLRRGRDAKKKTKNQAK
jgi:hypothetical protein